MPPPATGLRIPVHELAPKKGDSVCVSWRLRIGAENDCNCGVGDVGRYTT